MKKVFTILVAVLLTATVQLNAQWIQIGQDIDGKAANDLSGSSVSLSADGSVVAIGGFGNGGNGISSGHVRIYQNNAGTWTQIGVDIDGEAAGDWSGYYVSLSADGSVVAIGAPLNDGNDTIDSKRGHVRIYENISGTWTQIGSDIDGEAAGDDSGTVSLSSDGSIVAMGARGNDGNVSDAGHVRIYKSISATWTQIGNDIDGEAAGDWSGYNVSLSADGTVVAIGASGSDDNGNNSGHVRIYQNINGLWTQIGADIDGEAAGDQSGWSVSLSSDGSVVAIGANRNDGNGTWSGHVRIYQNISGNWIQIGNDIDGEAAEDNSGYSVSLSSDGTIVAIGGPNNQGNGFAAGHARIYENIAGIWTQIGADIDGEAAGDHFGRSVSLSADGAIVAIGAYYNDGNGTSAGHVRVYYNCSSHDTIFPVVCDTTYYSSPSGKLWTSTGTYLDTIANVMGCDSIITINLTINTSTSDTIAVVCDSITWYGTTYYSSAMPTHTFMNAAGCDSVVTLNLTIDTVDVSVTQNGTTLTANLSGASYQWLDCGNSYAIISGETNQSFIPTGTGNYAVIIDDGICIDTSSCYPIFFTQLNEHNNSEVIAIYPNPTKGKITIKGEKMERVEVVDITGKVLYEQLVSSDAAEIDISAFSKGVYFVKVFSADAVGVERIVLE